MENSKVTNQRNFNNVVEFKNDEDIINIILDNNVEQVCTITTKKLEKLNKKSRLVKEDTFEKVFGQQIYCTTTRDVIICADPNDLRIRLGEVVESEVKSEDVKHELPWGEWVQGSNYQIITHKDNFYLRTYLADTFFGKTYTYEDGKLVESDELSRLHEFQPPVQSDNNNSSNENDNKVIVNNITIGNILSIVIGDVRYVRK